MGVIFTEPFFILATIIMITLLMIWIGSLAYVLGLSTALLTLWAKKWDWAYFGLGNVKWIASIRPAIGYTLMIILINDFIMEPAVELITNSPVNLSNFEGLKGNVPGLLLMLTVMWVMAAFGEEFFFRGYLMNRLAHIFGNSGASWITAIFLSSIVFGFVHSYQGSSGIITTGVVGTILALAFYQNKDNLWVGILAHGMYDTFGLIMIYLGKNLVIKNTMIEVYQLIIKY